MAGQPVVSFLEAEQLAALLKSGDRDKTLVLDVRDDVGVGRAPGHFQRLNIVLAASWLQALATALLICCLLLSYQCTQTVAWLGGRSRLLQCHFLNRFCCCVDLSVMGAVQDFAGGHIKGCRNVTTDRFEDDSSVDAIIAEHCVGKDRVVVHCMMSQKRGPYCANRLAERLQVSDLALKPDVLILSGGYEKFGRLYSHDAELCED